MKSQALIYGKLTKAEMKEKDTLMNEELLFTIKERTIQDVRNKLDRMVSYIKARVNPLTEYKFLFRNRFYVHTTPKRKCNICNEEINVLYGPKGEIMWSIGHNAEPVNNGRCCGVCNTTVVLAERMRPILGERKSKELTAALAKLIH